MSSISRHTLQQYLSDLLKCDDYNDYAPNGLQVEGRAKISRIITGVTACQALIEKALMLKADAILVHHGYFWKGENPTLTGIKYQRIAKLICNEVSLFAYHLPLDGHPELGNNAQLAKMFDWSIEQDLSATYGKGVGMIGQVARTLSIEELQDQINEKLERVPQVIKAHQRPINRIAWCTGGAQSLIEDAIMQGADLYLSGEISEPTYHLAKEANIHYVAAGHHATERYGIHALGNHIADQFGVQVQFVDIHNPV